MFDIESAFRLTQTQLHVAHGYLLSQFLARSTNMRQDEYGGSLINRARILLEIIEAVKQTVQDPFFIISVKLNSQDFTHEGIDAEESITIAKLLEDAGVDFIEVSGGTYAQTVCSPEDKVRFLYFIINPRVDSKR